MTGRAKRRDRRAARAARRQSEFENHEAKAESREGLCSDILQETKKIPQDLALVKKSLRWGGLNGRKKRRIVDRLYSIVDKEYTTRVDDEGREIHDAEMADKNSMVASSILVTIEAQQQKDDHLTKRLEGQSKPQPQTTINVGVNVSANNDRQSRLMAIAERIRGQRNIGGNVIDVVRE